MADSSTPVVVLINKPVAVFVWEPVEVLVVFVGTKNNVELLVETGLNGGVVDSDVVPVLDDFHSPVVGFATVAEVVGVVTVAVVSPLGWVVIL